MVVHGDITEFSVVFLLMHRQHGVVSLDVFGTLFDHKKCRFQDSCNFCPGNWKCHYHSLLDQTPTDELNKTITHLTHHLEDRKWMVSYQHCHGSMDQIYAV